MNWVKTSMYVLGACIVLGVVSLFGSCGIGHYVKSKAVAEKEAEKKPPLQGGNDGQPSVYQSQDGQTVIEVSDPKQQVIVHGGRADLRPDTVGVTLPRSFRQGMGQMKATYGFYAGSGALLTANGFDVPMSYNEETGQSYITDRNSPQVQQWIADMQADNKLALGLSGKALKEAEKANEGVARVEGKVDSLGEKLDKLISVQSSQSSK